MNDYANNLAVMPRVEKCEDTTKLIFDHLFKCRVRGIDITSEDEMRAYGNYTTFDRGIDHALMDDIRIVYWPISRMADTFAEGAQVGIVDYKDTEIIYDYVTRHLNAWQRHLREGVNTGNAPLDDLLKLDRFANSVYEHAKYLLVQNGGVSEFERFMSTVFNSNFNVLGGFNGITQQIEQEPEPTRPESYPEREGMASLLKQHLVNSNFNRGS
jgi:hypothetical protein